MSVNLIQFYNIICKFLGMNFFDFAKLVSFQIAVLLNGCFLPFSFIKRMVASAGLLISMNWTQ